MVTLTFLNGCASGGSSHQPAAPGAPAPGNVDLTATPGDQSLMLPGTYLGAVTLPVLDINAGANPGQAMDAFLAQYAYYLFTDDPVQQQQTVDVISGTPGTRAQIAAGRAAFRKQARGRSTAMPIFWDTKQSPVTFTATRTAAGVHVRLSAGTLYLSMYDPARPPSDVTWQDGRGRDVNHRTTITDFSATFGPTTKSGGYSLSLVLSYSLH